MVTSREEIHEAMKKMKRGEHQSKIGKRQQKYKVIDHQGLF
jgi:hypothetical protein